MKFNKDDCHRLLPGTILLAHLVWRRLWVSLRDGARPASNHTLARISIIKDRFRFRGTLKLNNRRSSWPPSLRQYSDVVAKNEKIPFIWSTISQDDNVADSRIVSRLRDMFTIQGAFKVVSIYTQYESDEYTRGHFLFQDGRVLITIAIPTVITQLDTSAKISPWQRSTERWMTRRKRRSKHVSNLIMLFLY